MFLLSGVVDLTQSTREYEENMMMMMAKSVNLYHRREMRGVNGGL